MTSVVYRLYDYSGNLLYVGLTDDIVTRLQHHRARQSWGYYVDTYRANQYHDRKKARAVELRAIEMLRPHMNRTSKRPHRPLVHRSFRGPEQADEYAKTCSHRWAKLVGSGGLKCLKCGVRKVHLTHIKEQG